MPSRKTKTNKRMYFFLALFCSLALVGCNSDDNGNGNGDDNGNGDGNGNGNGLSVEFDKHGVLDQKAAVTEDNLDAINNDVGAMFSRYDGHIMGNDYISFIEDIVVEVTDHDDHFSSGDFDEPCPEGGSVSAANDSFANNYDREYEYDSCVVVVDEDGPGVLADKTIVVDGHRDNMREFDDSGAGGSTTEQSVDTRLVVTEQGSDEPLVAIREKYEYLLKSEQQEDDSWALEESHDMAVLEFLEADEYVVILDQEVTSTATADDTAGGGSWFFEGIEGEVTETIAAYGSTHVDGHYTIETTEALTYGPLSCSFTGDPTCDFTVLESNAPNAGVMQITGDGDNAEFRFGEDSQQNEMSVVLGDELVYFDMHSEFQDDWEGWIIRR